MPMITFQAHIRSDEGVRSIAKINQHELIIDEPPRLGGTDQGPNPLEYVLTALGGCINVLAHSFAPQFNVELHDLQVHVEGDLNPDGFRGIDPDAKVGYEEIRYEVTIDSPSANENIEALLAHVDAFCPVKDSLLGTKIVRTNK